jgi:phosphoribosylanthranilate isomerase
MEEYPETVILLDAFVPDLPGGTGRTVAPEILEKAAKNGRRIVIAGGVGPENLEFLLALRPYGLDACSAIEERPGIKDPERMRLLFRRKKELEKKIEREVKT